MQQNCKLNRMGQTTTNRVIVFSAKRKRIEFVNSQERNVRKIKLDDEKLPADFGLRCDGILVGDESMNWHEHYIELKGSNVRHAIDQLANTLKLLSREPRIQKKSCYAICSRIPRAGTDTQIVKKRFRALYSARLSFTSRNEKVHLT